jgi:hypothetical protein
MEQHTPTINSISGGKTSSYMAAHTSVDHNIFSLVLINDERCKPKDPAIVKEVSNKLGIDFTATAESDKTIKVVLDLEQVIGKEIIWTSSDSFDAIIKKRGALPNLMMRFCTTDMKIKPIFDWCTSRYEMVNMNLGIRLDEKERAYLKDGGKKPEKPFKTIIGKHENGKNKWGEIYWRNTLYPLIENKIGYKEIIDWAKSSKLDFPSDSNCVGCFWKNTQQLRKNWDDEPLKMQWFADQEIKKNRTFKKEMSYEQIKKIGLQQDFFFGTGAGCSAGFCTD